MRLIDAKELERQTKEAFKESPVVMGMLLRWIRKQSTIDPESLRKKGEWIDGSVSFGAKPETYKVCSNCNTCIPKMTEVPFSMWHFCLRCGADMRQKEAGNV